MSNAYGKKNFSTASNLENTSLLLSTNTTTSLAPVQVLEAVGLVAVIVGSVILNGLVCGVVWRTKPLRRRPTNIFILNLAISNALVALCVIPFSLQAVLKKAWEHSAVFCQVTFTLLKTLCVVLSFVLVIKVAPRTYLRRRPTKQQVDAVNSFYLRLSSYRIFDTFWKFLL